MVYRFSNIRTELGFGTMPEESLDYSRKGGCFVSLCKAVSILFLTLLFIIVLMIIVYASTRNAFECQTDGLDQYVRKPSPFIEKQNPALQLFRTKAYRLIMRPYINDTCFTDGCYFEGVVWIVVESRRSDKREINIRVRDLNVSTDYVRVCKSPKVPNLRDLSEAYLQRTHYLQKFRYKRNENSEIIDNDTRNSGETETESSTQSDDETIASSSPMTIVTELDATSSTHEYHESTIPCSTTDLISSNVLITTKSQHDDNDLTPKNINKVSVDPDDEVLNISLEMELARGTHYTILVPFSGYMTNDKGFFFKRFDQPNNNSSFLAGTFTNPEYTHSIMPCFDDDDFQSTFDISIIRSTEHKSASNSRLESSTIIDDNLIMDNYSPTPPMPPAELGFIITNINSYDLPINDNLKLSLFTQEENVTKINYTMNAIQHFVNIIENYTSVPFNMDKLNYVILPHRQNYREIKNGMIITSEYFIPISTDAYSSKQAITYDLAFQWFDGINQYELNEEIWLKRAFPLFLQQVALDVNDESDYYEAKYFRFKSKVMEDEMDFSRFKLTREIDEDRLDRYIMDFMEKKGLCILKMFNYTLSSEVFRESVSYYFLNRTHNQTIDFYSTLHNVTLLQPNKPKGINLINVFSQWITLDQIPLIDVKQFKNGSFHLTQKIVKFNDTIAAEENTRIIPITYHYFGSNTDNLIWIKRKNYCLENPKNSSYILLNPSGTGYYRTNYEYGTWRQIIAHLEGNGDQFTAMKKAVLLDDAFNLARYGKIGYEIVFDMIKAITDYDVSMLPWKIVFGNFEYIYRNMQSMPNFYYVVRFFESVINQIIKNINKTETENISVINELDKLAILVEQWSCKLGFSACLQNVKIEFKRLIESKTTKNIPETEDYLYMIFCTTIKYGGWREWHTIESNLNMSAYFTSVFIRSLGCTREPLLMAKYIDYLLTSDEDEFSFIKRQHTEDVIQSISENQVMIKYAMEYFLERWHDLMQVEEMDPRNFGAIFKRISSEKEFNILKSIFFKYPETFDDSDRVKLAFKHTLHNINTTLKWKTEIAIKINREMLRL